MSTMEKMEKKKKTVGKYELGKLLGEGTFGKVQLGKDIETGDKVAVKILSKWAPLISLYLSIVKKLFRKLVLLEKILTVQLVPLLILAGLIPTALYPFANVE